MRPWSRYVRWRAHGRNGATTDGSAGFTIVEILVAIILLSIALIGTAGEVAVYVKQQKVEHTQVVANHVADSWFEYAESLTHSTTLQTADSTNANLDPIVNPTNPTTVGPLDGVTYSEVTTPRFCPATTDPASLNLESCPTSGTASDSTTIYDTIVITWDIGGQTHTLTQTRNLADNSYYTAQDTQDPANNGLSNCHREGTIVPGSDSLTLSPATQQQVSGTAGPAFVDGAAPGVLTRNPDGSTTSGVTATLTEKGLVNTTNTDNDNADAIGPATCVPLYWTDGNGTHQVDMHTTSACGIDSSNFDSAPPTCTYTATVPASSVHYPNIGTPYNTSFDFCAYLLGDYDATTNPCTTGMSTTTSIAASQFFVNAQPSIDGCYVPTPMVTLNLLLSRGTVAKYTIYCSAVSSFPISDTINVNYPMANGSTQNLTLSYAGGTTWSGDLPAHTLIKTGASIDHWIFTATRMFDQQPAAFPQGSNQTTLNLTNLVTGT